MNEAIVRRNELLSKKLIQNLNVRRFEAYYCSTKDEALQQIRSLIPSKHVVSWGGSTSLVELGVQSHLKELGYQVIDRDIATSDEERYEMMRQALLCDTYLMSANAISEDGILFHVDGNGNRAAALCFGPSSVIVVIGMNKVVASKKDAYTRARTIAAPINTQRVYKHKELSDSEKMPCLYNGACSDCLSEQSICSMVVETRRSNYKNRIKVILVGEDLGF